MERPRLRPLEGFPIEENGQMFLALRDPSGITESVAKLPRTVVAILQLFDGENSRDEICAEYEKRTRSRLPREVLDQLIEQLDRADLLDSDRFRSHVAKVLAEFRDGKDRPAFLAGKSYPKDATELTKLLNSFYEGPGGPGHAQATDQSLPRAIVAPHIDFVRGGPAYAWIYKTLQETTEVPDIVVVFGTSHAGGSQPFNLTRKSYQTPLGTIATAVDVVDEFVGHVTARLGPGAGQSLFLDEHHHRGEHSIEFQMVWLRHAFGGRADSLRALPILCGSMHDLIDAGGEPKDHALWSQLTAILRETLAGKKVLWVGGVDLAHVGPRFGDEQPLDQDDCKSLERRDQEMLQPCLRGDANGWFQELAREKDARRVCGLSPIYALLETANVSQGSLLAYGQCPADDNGGSIVSIASLLYRN